MLSPSPQFEIFLVSNKNLNPQVLSSEINLKSIGVPGTDSLKNSLQSDQPFWRYDLTTKEIFYYQRKENRQLENWGLVEISQQGKGMIQSQPNFTLNNIQEAWNNYQKKASKFSQNSNRTTTQRNQILKRSNQSSKNHKLAFIQGQQRWGNDKIGQEWVKEQQRRNQEEREEKISFNNPKVFQTKKVIKIGSDLSSIILNQLKKKGAIYEDLSFPRVIMLNQMPAHQWKRISEQLPHDRIFVNKPMPNDIRQGTLGNCYLLAALSALAERPDRIFKLFLLHTKNAQSFYAMKILYQGKWKIIYVDDWIPFHKGTTIPLFCYSNSNQIWPILLEKAWAKLYGSYANIQGGIPEQALHNLTGAPCSWYHLQTQAVKDKQNLWNILQQASKKEYAMVVGTYGLTKEQYAFNNIEGQHAYTLLNAIQMTVEGQGPKQRVVQLRNPWGHKQADTKGNSQTMKWSDFDYKNWDKVSPEQKARVGYSYNPQDGIFFMSFDDFIRLFFEVFIAKINDNASYAYKSHWDPQGNGVFFRVQIWKEGNYSFQLDNIPMKSFTLRYPFPNLELNIARKQEIIQLMKVV